MPGKRAQLALPRRRGELLQGGDPQLLPDQRDLLRAQPRDLEPLGQPGRDFLLQLFQERQRAGAQQLVDLLGDGLAHAGDLAQLLFLPVLVCVPGQGQQALRRLAIGQRHVDGLSLYLQEVGDQGERVSKLTVVHAAPDRLPRVGANRNNRPLRMRPTESPGRLTKKTDRS